MKKNKINTIFVDCFNTIIGRRENPITVLLNFSKEIEKEYDPLKKINFFTAYKYSIKQIQNRLIQEGVEKEYTFKEVIEYIYFHFDLKKLLKIEFAEFYQKTYSYYYKTELNTFFVKKRTINFLKKKKKENCKIYIVSDFYCGKETIRNWIIDAGLKEFDSIFDDIFVSCDFKKSKSTCGLYKEVLKKLNVPTNNVMMIGDNILPDIIKAKKSGIKKAKEVFPPKIRLVPLSYFKKKNSFRIPLEFKKLIKENKNKSFANLSFTFYSFIEQLAKDCLEKKYKNIIFFARDGRFLKRLFDKYCELNNLSIESFYCHANRSSVYLLTRKGISKKDLHELASKHFININCFLESLGFNKETINKIVDKSLIKNPNKRFFVLENSKTYENLINSDVFIKETTNRMIEQKKNFLKYFEKFKKNNNSYCFVDVGWNGRVQSYLNNLFKKDINLNGYYIGLTCDRPKESNIKKYGLLFAKTIKNSYFMNSLNKFRFLQYEQLCRAGESRCIEYNKKGNPVFVAIKDEIEGFNIYAKKWQDNIFEAFIKIDAIQKKINFPYFNLLGSKMYLMTLKSNSFKTNYEYAKCQNSHFDSFARTGYNMRFAPLMKTLYLSCLNKFFFLINYKKITKRVF